MQVEEIEILVVQSFVVEFFSSLFRTPARF